MFGRESLDHVVLEAVAKALLDDRSRHVPGAKARQPRTLLIALNLQLGFAGHFSGWDLDGNLPLHVFIMIAGRFGLSFSLGVFAGLCGAHVAPFASRSPRRLRRANEANPNSYGVNLSVKREAGSVKQTGGQYIQTAKCSLPYIGPDFDFEPTPPARSQGTRLPRLLGMENTSDAVIGERRIITSKVMAV